MSELAVVPPEPHHGLTRDQIDLVKRTICPDATDDELALFVQQCNRTGLDPFARQIHAVKRYDSQSRTQKMAIQVGIDGLRLIAQRTGEYQGRIGPQWCGPDGQWRDVWLEPAPPAAARVAVIRAGFAEPLWSTALWRESVQTTRDGDPNRMWNTMGTVMLAKVAEAAALRAAFPAEMSGLYTGDEIASTPVVRKPDYELPEGWESYEELEAAWMQLIADTDSIEDDNDRGAVKAWLKSEGVKRATFTRAVADTWEGMIPIVGEVVGDEQPFGDDPLEQGAEDDPDEGNGDGTLEYPPGEEPFD